MLSIDEAIARERQLAKEQRSHIGTWDDEYSKKCEVYAEEHEQLAEWLEELKENRIALAKASKALDANARLGYNKAIDDFKKEMIRSSLTEREKEYIRYKAEQLKAGDK